MFIRSLAGLDHAAAKRVFDTFLQGRTLAANQHELIDMIVDHLTQRGTMNPELLKLKQRTGWSAGGRSGGA